MGRRRRTRWTGFNCVVGYCGALFFLPSASRSQVLSRRFPEEGGMYIWTKRAFGDQHAFLCGWFYFISNDSLFSVSPAGRNQHDDATHLAPRVNASLRIANSRCPSRSPSYGALLPLTFSA